MDSSSASSPFSTRSTDASSPEASGSGDQKPSIGLGFPHGYGGVMPMPGMQGIFNGYPHSPFLVYPNGQNMMHHSPPMQDIKPSFLELARTTASSSRGGGRAEDAGGDGGKSAAASVTGSHAHGGTRSEPPHRLMEVEGLNIVKTSVGELAATSSMNRILLQGDPQVITKQRVETAIRVIIDLLRHIPPTPTSPPIHPSLSPLILRDSSGNILTTLERIDTFRSLRLQYGTTTKAASKKQIQAGPTPPSELAYLETAVYTSGPGELGKRVYACRRCRMREAKRRVSKDANKKKQPSSGSDSSSKDKEEKAQKALVGINGTTVGQDYITGANPEQYDPMRASQEVEEPVWDPGSSDWRHEIVLFNSPPEVLIKDGSVVWLPFRVVCYGKCHGEKVGFRIRFTFRSHTGEVIATALTNPIRITDDHKTESKGKPKIEGLTSTNAKPPVARARKAGRQSAASSRRQSPVPSEAESVQSKSEAGAFMAKQTPQVRAGKPYERPPTHSPLTGNAPIDAFAQNDRPPPFRRQHSGTSIHSVASFTALPTHNVDTVNPMRMGPNEFPTFDPVYGRSTGTVSPGALRRPQFDFTTLDGGSSFPGSSTHSAASSNVASPISRNMGLTAENLLFSNDGSSPTDLMQALAFHNMPTAYPGGPDFSQQNIQPRRAPMVSGLNDADVDMSNTMNSTFDSIFDTSSHTSLVSGYDPDEGNSFTSGIPDGSLFSDSGVVPDDMQGFLDFSGGEDQELAGPSFSASPSPITPFGNLSPHRGIDPTMAYSQHSLSPYPPSMPPVPPPQLAPLPALAAPASPLNPPTIITVIPSEGPVAGGTTVAIIGTNFAPGIAVMFGDRPAKLQRIDPTFIQCISPPAVGAGVVEVGIQGVVRAVGMPPAFFKYNKMDTDLMMLALQVKDQYQGSSSDAAYRLAHHVAARSRSNGGSDWSDPNASSPSNYGPSPKDMSSFRTHARSSSANKEDLETTILNFIASLDEDAPGSLRRSGAVNTVNEAKQSLLHVATVMGYQRLLRRLVFIGAHLDSQDINGYTPLGLASLRGELACARVLIEAGAAYDRPTTFGEMPLDLAKVGECEDVEALLLSAVWSTAPERKTGKRDGSVSVVSDALGGMETSSEIDDDNPSSGSEGEGEEDEGLSRRLGMMKPKKAVRRVKGKVPGKIASPKRNKSRRSSLSAVPLATPVVAPNENDDPPPYEPPRPKSDTDSSWMSRTLTSSSSTLGIPLTPSQFRFPQPLTSTVLNHLPPTLHSFLDKTASIPNDWVNWEAIQRMASPEEVKLFGQAMAAAAFNKVVQSGATSGSVGVEDRNVSHKRRGSGGKKKTRGDSPGGTVVKHVKRDRMLYLFWLPILLFVGFWLMVTAVPIATGFCLIYARQITRYIKQRV